MTGIGPVVGDLARRVVAHHVGAGASRLSERQAMRLSPHGLLDEPVHLAAVDVADVGVGSMRPAAVAIVPIVIGLDAAALRVVDAGPPGDSVDAVAELADVLV